jgi:hypothetical protein
MADVLRTGHFDTSGTGGVQQATVATRITDAKGQAVTVTPAVSTVKAHVPTVKPVNPSSKHAS